jgi:hypothetical protein
MADGDCDYILAHRDGNKGVVHSDDIVRIHATPFGRLHWLILGMILLSAFGIWISILFKKVIVIIYLLPRCLPTYYL